MLEEVLAIWRMRPDRREQRPLRRRGHEACRGQRRPVPAGPARRFACPSWTASPSPSKSNATPNWPVPPIMMLSSADRSGDAARCRELGVACYLRKPITQSELFDAILTAMGAAPLESTGVAPHRQGRCGAGQRPLRILAGGRQRGQPGYWRSRPWRSAGTPSWWPATAGRRWPPGTGGRGSRPDGHADARDGRLRRDRRHPGAREGDGARTPHRGLDRPRHEGRSRALPGGGHGCVCIQAAARRRTLCGHCSARTRRSAGRSGEHGNSGADYPRATNRGGVRPESRPSPVSRAMESCCGK